VNETLFTPSGIVVSIFTQLAPPHPPPSGPVITIEFSTTFTEPVAQDCEAVQSPKPSALATVDHNANKATGAKIIQRLELEAMTMIPHPNKSFLLVLVLVPANHSYYQATMMDTEMEQQTYLFLHCKHNQFQHIVYECFRCMKYEHNADP
jgi:hypothetical protein